MMLAPVPDNQFAREVHAGLSGFGQKTLPCRYLYDSVGSALFEAITYLAEYGLTRADARILQSHAAEITGCLPGPLTVAELGSGSGIKTRPVLESLRQRQSLSHYPRRITPRRITQSTSPPRRWRCACGNWKRSPRWSPSRTAIWKGWA